MLARFRVTTSSPTQIIEITSDINKIIAQSGIDSGICTVFCPHSTAGIAITENSDSEMLVNMIQGFERAFPTSGLTAVNNKASAYLKSMLTGNSLNIIITDGNLLLGNWQGVFLLEHGGPKNRSIFVKIVEG